MSLHKGIHRYFYDAPPGGCGDMHLDDDVGQFVLHADHLVALTASEARVKRLEIALQNCIREMSWVLDKKVGGPVMDGGLFEKVRNQARSALRDVTATKGEAK